MNNIQMEFPCEGNYEADNWENNITPVSPDACIINCRVRECENCGFCKAFAHNHRVMQK